MLLGFSGDRWWLATMMLFGPRWVYGLPLVLLVTAAAIRPRRLLWPLVAGAIVVVVPLLSQKSLLSPPFRAGPSDPISEVL
jgi:hypothetical protein